MQNIPEKVKTLLDEYFDLLESKLPDLLEAYYIYGSVSLGAFDYGFSDIDFIAVTRKKITESEINTLKEVHRSVKKKFPKTDLMGLYLTEKDLQQRHENGESCPCFIDGVFKGLEKFEKNSIDAYQLKKYGITLKGQEIGLYDYTVDWDILINNMRKNLNTYWLNWMKGCEKFPSIRFIGSFISLGTIEWGVLGVSRLYYTFREKDMTSKVGAGEYAIKAVPQRWHKIIKESMRLRKNINNSYYKSIFERRKDALNYIAFIIQESNKLFNDKI
jgi:hypothetical protein